MNVTTKLLGAMTIAAVGLLSSCQDLSNPKEGDSAQIEAGNVSFEMVYVAPGDFRMGATAEQKGTEPNEIPSHDVKITKGYWIGKMEVTQEQWQQVMGKNPSLFKGEAGKENLQLPVNGVTWAEAKTFTEKLSSLSGYKFRLPTEAEWEFAARGGHKADGLMYSGSIYVDNVACYKSNSNGAPSPVGIYMPNKLELRDMSGNVAELVADNYELFKDSLYTDPLVFTNDTLPHVAKGGSFANGQAGVRTSSREMVHTDSRLVTIGLRVVMEPVAAQ